MKAIEIQQPGGPEVLVPTERPKPVPKAGEVLIEVRAAGINRPDVLQRMGNYPVPPGASDLPGLEVAGIVVDIGDASALDDLHLTIGDPVCALVQGGGYAQYCTAPAAQCLPVPRGLSMVEAASLPETFFTVWSNVFDRARLGTDAAGRAETLLVQGGTSGIGVTAIQLARALGHRVFATAGSNDKARACEKLGAERGINYRDEDFVAIVKELTEGRGADVILDMVGGDYVPREIKALADDGRLVLIALARRIEGRDRPRTDPAAPPHGHRIDASSARRGLQGEDRAQPSGTRVAAPRGQGDQAGGVQDLRARCGGRCASPDGEQHPRGQDRARSGALRRTTLGPGLRRGDCAPRRTVV